VAEVTTIAILDTQGPEVSSAYRELLPGVEVVGAEPESLRGRACHPHGAWCGWLAAVPSIGAQRPIRIAFIRVFDEAPNWVATPDWIAGAIREFRPQFVSRSFGAWDGDDPIVAKFAREATRELSAMLAALREEVGFVSFAAAGNNDRNDRDPDVAIPQDREEWTHVIGACRRDGTPAPWSGDGRNVRCVMWADDVWSPGPDGRWWKWRGTSAAAPKACGAAAASGMGDATYLEHLMRWASRPRGRKHELPHRKWGWGCDEDHWQRWVAQAPEAIWRGKPAGSGAGVRVMAHDYRWLSFEAFAAGAAAGSGERAGARPADTGAGGTARTGA